VVALVVLVTIVADLTMGVCGDRLIEVVDRIPFSCWLYIHVNLMNIRHITLLTFRTRDSIDIIEDWALSPPACSEGVSSTEMRACFEVEADDLALALCLHEPLC
jgi:hypothetical protein